MEYKLSTDSDYIAVAGTEITGLESGTYNIRYAAKAGFNAGTAVNILVPAGSNSGAANTGVPAGSNTDQGAPTGLAAVAPTTYGGSDGEVTGNNCSNGI